MWFASLALLAAPLQEPPLTTELVVDGLEGPTWIGAIPGDDRIFVCERAPGRLRVAKDGVLKPTPFLDLTGLVATEGERGLVAAAFHPDYATNGAFYVMYSAHGEFTVLARYLVSATDPDVADPTSGAVLLVQHQPGTKHTLGDLGFGPLDGHLYVAMGQAQVPGETCGGQTPGDLRGKILRLAVDGGPAYAIPPDNPFLGGAYPPETWSIGWRNPWRIGFDALTGELYVGDVGSSYFEEVNHEPALAGGRNYGWAPMEGGTCHPSSSCGPGVPPCGDPSLVPPVHVFDHTVGCAMIGGEAYRGGAIPGLQGAYVFADYCTARVWSLRVVGGVATALEEHSVNLAPGGALDLGSLSTFGRDVAGEILLADYFDGEVFRVVAAASDNDDCDGDGTPDADEIAAQPGLDLDLSGVLDNCEGLVASTGTISVQTGGAVVFGVDAGLAHAGRSYFLLGSDSGSTPGLQAYSVVVPLSIYDAYFVTSATSPNSGPFVDTFGTLDANGFAFAAVVFPPLSPAQIGNTLHHAAAILDLTGVGPLLADSSHALPLTFVP